MGFFDTLQAIVIWLLPTGTPHSGWVNFCGFNGFSFFYIFQAIAWFYGSWLMTFEYQRLLSEAWYSNQMFWLLNLIFEVIGFAIQIRYYAIAVYMLVISSINILANLTLVVLMFKTEKRTL